MLIKMIASMMTLVGSEEINDMKGHRGHLTIWQFKNLNILKILKILMSLMIWTTLLLSLTGDGTRGEQQKKRRLSGD